MLMLLTRLLKPRPRCAPRRTWHEVVRPDLVAEDDDTEATDERPPGCGWYASSHELHCGLAVTEHLSADAVAGDLPLGDWLELHLSGWRGGVEAGVGR